MEITDIDNIIKLLAPVVPIWSEFGLQMGIDSDTLDTYDQPLQLNRCLRDTIKAWIDLKSESATFVALLSAISGTLVGNKALADTLRSDEELLESLTHGKMTMLHWAIFQYNYIIAVLR